jgi:hypothetical protein
MPNRETIASENDKASDVDRLVVYRPELDGKSWADGGCLREGETVVMMSADGEVGRLAAFVLRFLNHHRRGRQGNLVAPSAHPASA